MLNEPSSQCPVAVPRLIAMAKMQCWARLAIATASAEFPEFTIMHTMSIFSLRPVDMATAGRHVQDSVVGAENANVDEKLKTLAAAFCPRCGGGCAPPGGCAPAVRWLCPALLRHHMGRWS